MSQDALVYATPHNAEPVLAGTLVLMSIFRNSACPHAAQKIVHNLALLSNRPELSEEFRNLCGRLCEEWRCMPFSSVASSPQPVSVKQSETVH